jgi:hypothetical protein
MVHPKTTDWWVAAALASAALPQAFAQPATAVDAAKTGLATESSTAAGGKTTHTPIYVDSANGRKFTTGPESKLHLLFPDQSAMTLGPNSEIVIDKYRFDKQSQSGEIVANMVKGALRVVGGLISKKTETTVKVGTATIGIRGGISLVETNGTQTTATFLFGNNMQVTGGNGSTTNITRPGFGTSFNSSNFGGFAQTGGFSGNPGGGGAGGGDGGGGGGGLDSDRLVGGSIKASAVITLNQLLGSNQINNLLS